MHCQLENGILHLDIYCWKVAQKNACSKAMPNVIHTSACSTNLTTLISYYEFTSAIKTWIWNISSCYFLLKNYTKEQVQSWCMSYFTVLILFYYPDLIFKANYCKDNLKMENYILIFIVEKLQKEQFQQFFPHLTPTNLTTLIS